MSGLGLLLLLLLVAAADRLQELMTFNTVFVEDDEDAGWGPTTQRA